MFQCSAFLSMPIIKSEVTFVHLSIVIIDFFIERKYKVVNDNVAED